MDKVSGVVLSNDGSEAVLKMSDGNFVSVWRGEESETAFRSAFPIGTSLAAHRCNPASA